MIVVDTSAIVAILFGEPGFENLVEKLRRSRTSMSAATRVELGIVIEAKKGPQGTQLLEELLERTGTHILPVDTKTTNEAIIAFRRFGKGRHRAALNFGDTFSYALARQTSSPLLFVGDDFSQTDIEAA